MAFCRECGKKIGDDVTVCPLCGAASGAAPRKKPAPTQAEAQAARQRAAQAERPSSGKAQAGSADARQAPQSKGKKEKADAAAVQEPAYNEQEDIKTNKMMAALSYLLFFLPLVTEPAKTSKFARFHANQGLVFLIFYAVIIIVTRILSAVFFNAFLWKIWWLWFFIDLIIWLIYVVMAGFAARNAYKAYKGEWRKLPIIGKITIIK